MSDTDKIIIRKWRSGDFKLTGWEVWTPDCQVRNFADWSSAIAYADRLTRPKRKRKDGHHGLIERFTGYEPTKDDYALAGPKK